MVVGRCSSELSDPKPERNQKSHSLRPKRSGGVCSSTFPQITVLLAIFINNTTPFSTASGPCGSPSNLILSQLVVEDERPMSAKKLVKLLVLTSFAKIKSVARVSSGHGELRGRE
jgi:hypothetical protein